jgi:hypothetical protein
MAKSWPWRHSISIWLHFHRAHSLQLNDCGRWTKNSFDSAAERSINRPQTLQLEAVRSDRAPFFTAGMNMNLCSFALTFCVWFTLGPTDAQPRSFLLSVIPVSFSGQFFHSDSKSKCSFPKKTFDLDSSASRWHHSESGVTGTPAQWRLGQLPPRMTVHLSKLFSIWRNKLRGQRKWKSRVWGQSVADRWGKSRDQVGSKTTNHVTCLQTIIFFWWKLICL